MRIKLINLKRDAARLRAANAQLRKIGLSYERFEAVDAKTLSKVACRQSVNSFRWWCAVGRPIRIGEIGCAMSHYSIYRKMTEPVCVLEDDVILDSRFPHVLDYVERHLDLSRPQVVLLSNHTRCVPAVSGQPTIQVARGDMYTEGYVITPLAAQALLRANWPLQTPCDHWGRWVKRGIIELYHAFPTVCRQDQAQYVSGTVDSNCFKVANLSPVRFAIHKFKRLIGKIIDIMLPL